MPSPEKPEPDDRPNPWAERAHRLGRWGESTAAEYLRREGWRILERNYRFGRREVDLVVRRGDLVAFVEVKTRAGSRYGSPEEAVTWTKRREIELVAQQYLTSRGVGDVDVRFDVVSIVVDASRGMPRILHLPAAWRPQPPR